MIVLKSHSQNILKIFFLTFIKPPILYIPLLISIKKGMRLVCILSALLKVLIFNLDLIRVIIAQQLTFVSYSCKKNSSSLLCHEVVSSTSGINIWTTLTFCLYHSSVLLLKIPFNSYLFR